MSAARYECRCAQCAEVLTDESMLDLARRMWVHEAKHPQGVPDLDTIYKRMKRVEPAKEGVLLQ